MNLRSLAAVVAVTLSGCAITQDVQPVGLDRGAHDLCLVRNSEVVQDGFHDVYVRVLEKKGFKVRSLPDKAAVNSCPLLATYEAIYRWDLAIYLARADLRIFADGKEVGRAVYDSLSGGANMGKFIRTEPKLTELVEQIFPKLRAYLRTNQRPHAAA
ncbi:Sbal_3080 family lipoprotein [Hydrogenophaga sp.]|uniref:Sbal_3080 family lipoprotein n=1 Tax=Hydrogenophaga sp. TaxID=1904254 RepID=UPI00273171CA|nr:Sbal_3080 family lipoprotein [Hydrogenophaga sp.]MDP1688148.1 Sbal_3080 family lipoprotein [Hydrogenophaga sp.]